MEQFKITLVRSLIDRPQKQKDTAKHLGLKKREQSVVKPKNDQILGMVKKINHLVKVESV